MTSQLFDSIGLGGLDIGFILIVLAVINLILIVWLAIQTGNMVSLKKKYNKFMRGKSGESLENAMNELYDDNDSIKSEFETNRNNIRDLKKNQEFCFQKLGLVKYDAYDQMGGKLSFCIVMLNEKNNGFLINSVQGTEGCYIYTKEIKKGECELTLGTEEREALDQALGY